MSAEDETNPLQPHSAHAPNAVPFGGHHDDATETEPTMVSHLAPFAELGSGAGQDSDATEAQPTPLAISAPVPETEAIGGQLPDTIEGDV